MGVFVNQYVIPAFHSELPATYFHHRVWCTLRILVGPIKNKYLLPSER